MTCSAVSSVSPAPRSAVASEPKATFLRRDSREQWRLTPSHRWVAYFQQNARHPRPVPWESATDQAKNDLPEILKSLRSWQLGETSDGRRLLAAARKYAERQGDPEFVDAIRLFITEEQRHGAALGAVLDLAGVPRKTADWGDTVFRTLRYVLPTMEVWVTPVVMVETHAMIYYSAVRRATRSEVLRRVCEQLLADEVAHLRFQCERLAILHRDRPRWRRRLTYLAHRFLFAGITAAIWVGHAPALRAGGYTWRRFWRTAWARMGQAWRRMKPEAYVELAEGQVG